MGLRKHASVKGLVREIRLSDLTAVETMGLLEMTVVVVAPSSPSGKQATLTASSNLKHCIKGQSIPQLKMKRSPDVGAGILDGSAIL